MHGQKSKNLPDISFRAFACLVALAVAGCSSNEQTDEFFNGGSGGFGRIGSSALSISPVTTDFGAVQTYSTSSPATITVQNSSPYNVYLSSIASPSNVHYSLQSTTCSVGPTAALAPGASCSLVVVFHPTEVGQIDYGLPINYNGGSTTQTYTTAAALTGIGATTVVFAGVTSVDTIRSQSVRLNWTDVANENGYALFTIVSGAMVFQGTVPKDSTSGTVTGLTAGTLHTFRVRAFDYFGNLETNTTDLTAATLAAPVLTAVADRTYAVADPLQVGSTLTIDIDNTLTGDDTYLTYTCTYDTVLDGAVASGTNCSALTGVTLSPGFAGTPSSVDGNGELTFTPPTSLAGKSYEFKIAASDTSNTINRIFKVNVKASFIYDSTLLLAYQAENATGTSPGINSPFTSTWKNLAPTGVVLDGSLASGTFATGWLGTGTWITNPYRLSFAGTSGATADRVLSGTSLSSAANLMFTSWLYPTNISLGSTATVFGNRETTTDGWTVRQRSDGLYEFIVGNSSIGSYASAVTSLSPAAYFKFDEVAGTTTTDQVSATAITITNNGSVAKGSTGAYGGSTGFNFSGNGVVLMSPIIDIATNWTVSGWVKMPLPATANWKTLVRGNANDHHLIFNNATHEFGVYYASTGQNFVGSGLDADTLSAGWHHFATVGIGANTRFYVDGAFVSQVAGISQTDFYAVGNYQVGGQPIGEVDDVALFTTSLTDAQILQIYQGACIVPLSQTTWTHLGGRYTGSVAELYKNGTKVCEYSPSGSITGTSDAFTVGAKSDGSEAWPGQVGSLYVYNTGTAGNIVTNYNAQFEEFGLAASCAEWLTRGSTSDGVYDIDVDGTGPLAPFSAQCDMTTDGGGWTLVLNYLHQGGTNPAVTARTTSFPVISSSTLGVNESASTANWGHAAPALLTNVSWTNARYYCQTSAHARTLHFKSNSTLCKTYYNSGTGSCTDTTATFTGLTGHNANIPAAFAPDGSFASQGVNAMTDFPFYRSGTYHWGIRGLGARWECDDFAGGSANNTLHRIWVR